MTINSLAHVPDRELIDATGRAAADERRATVELLALLGEVDARRLYLSEGFSSLFVYCTQELKLSEHEAYHRIEAARAARAFPIILVRLRERALTLTTVTLLRPHLTPVNADALAYLNRLSDHLFVAARRLAADEGGDVLWQPGATRDS